ncbi:MAG: hypothetical protein ACRDYY_12980 [Acidimicrobiales bacterium]
MASERKPELVIVDTLKDKHNRTVKVGHRGDDVEVIVTPHSGHDGRISFDAGQRDRFIRAWAESEKQAERNGSPVVRACCDHCDNSEATGHGYTISGPHASRCEECAAERARREHDAGTGD